MVSAFERKESWPFNVAGRRRAGALWRAAGAAGELVRQLERDFHRR